MVRIRVWQFIDDMKSQLFRALYKIYNLIQFVFARPLMESWYVLNVSGMIVYLFLFVYSHICRRIFGIMAIMKMNFYDQ